MATFIPELPYKKADGTLRVQIRVTHNREIRRISTHIFVTPDQLTRAGKLKDPEIIDQCAKITAKCRDICNRLAFDMVAMPIDELMAIIKDGLQGEKFRLNFIDFARGKIDAMSKGTARTYTSAINAVERFAGADLDILEINSDFLRRFEKFIETEPSQRGSNRKGEQVERQGKGQRAVSLYMSCLRAVHNLAKEEYNDEDRGVIRIPYSPFNKFKVKPQPLTRKRALSVDTIQKIINLQCEPGVRAELAKDCFILSFVLLGMNSADMYRADKAAGGVLTYFRAKTEMRRADRAEMHVEVEPCISALMEKYEDDYRLFNFCRRYSNAETFNTALNKGLKTIGEQVGVADLQFYAARHSWATIARSRAVQVDKATVHEALNHVDDAMKVTDIYLDKDWSVIWEANRKVLDLFDWSAIGYDLL